MKLKVTALLLSVLWALSPPAVLLAQQRGPVVSAFPGAAASSSLPATITASGATTSEFVLGYPTVTVQLTGTWTGTIQFEASNDNATFVTVNCTPSNSTTAVVNTTANGLWACALNGAKYFHLNATSWTSGTANVTAELLAAKIGGGGGGGGGSGTVNSGTINQLAYYAASGTAVSGETLLQAVNMPALTGAVTNTAGTLATTSASKFLVQGTADANLTAAQFLGALASGCLSVTTTTGVVASSGSACGTSTGTVTTTGSPVSGQVSFFTGASSISGDSNLTWDNTAKTLALGTGNSVTITTAALTGNRTFTLPDANSNPVVPSTCATNTWASGVSAAGVISCVGYPLLAPNGAVGTPQFSFANSTNTGLYLLSAGALGITAGGTLGLQVQAGGIQVPPASNTAPSVTDITFGNTGLFWPQTNAMGIGNVTDGLWCRWLSEIYDCRRASTDAVGYAVQIRKARGTMNLPSVITTGDALFTQSGYGYVGATNTYLEAARIESDSTGTIADATTGIGGIVIISTTLAGTDASVQENVRFLGGSIPYMTLKGSTFANLPAAANGSLYYCTNCAPASAVDQTCAGASTGALAFRANGVWKCLS